MLALRPARFLFVLVSVLAGLAACQGATSSAPPVTAPLAFSTTVPIPSATATTVTLPSSGGTQLSLTLPQITGASAGSTVGVTVTSLRPSTAPSAAPAANTYVSLSLPAGAIAHGVPTVSAPSGTSQWAYGTVAFPSLALAPAAHGRRASYSITYSVVFDPNALDASGETVTFTGDVLYGLENVGSIYAFTPNVTTLADGASVTTQATVVNPRSPIDPSKWTVLTDPTSAQYVHASTKPCASNASNCFDATIAFANPGPYAANLAQVGLLYYQDPYLVTSYIYSAAPPTPTPTPVPTPSPTPVVSTLPNFQFYPTLNEIVTPDVPAASTFGFTAANISLPDVASPPPAAPMKVTTSVGPIDPVVAQQLAQLSKTPVATVTFNYGQAVAFSPVGNLTADFCFPAGSLTTATAYVFYDAGSGLALHAVPTTLAANDATCTTSVHVAALSDFGTSSIAATTDWGYVISIP